MNTETQSHLAAGDGPAVQAQGPTEGGPAFPFATVDGHLCLGMTLRDYFAAKALQGWLASYADQQRHPVEAGVADICAQHAYALADAMLKARQS
jgi:hypothetical protein